MIRFAVFSDLHYEHIPDGDRRMDYFLEHIKNEKLDFIMELGDFAYPVPKNKRLIEKLEALCVPIYFVLGNHDLDCYTKAQVLKFFNRDKSYYAFRVKEVKFIVLDACYIRNGNKIMSYSKEKNKKKIGIYPYIPVAELEWLKHELSDETKRYVIFSHHSLVNEFAQRGIANREAVRRIIDEASDRGKQVLLCMNGHDHGVDIKKVYKTYYYTLNAMSYIWVGGMYEHLSYDKALDEKYPYLKELILYEEGLNAIATIDQLGLEIQGMEGHYQKINPKDLGIGDYWNGCLVKPVVPSLKITWPYKG